MSLAFLGRATVLAAIMVGFVPAPAHAATLAVDVFCESTGRLHVLCERTITGGTAPFTTKWFYNNNYFAAYDNKQFTGWSCTLGGPNSYKAVVTDAAGASATDTSGVGCISGNP